MTLNSGLDKRRSNSLSTRGCGERRQMESLDELERFVATLLRVGKTGRVGKDLRGRCSRIVTDRLGEFRGEKATAGDRTEDGEGGRGGGSQPAPGSILSEKARKIGVFAA